MMFYRQRVFQAMDGPEASKEVVKQKYRLLFSPKRVRRPGPKGPIEELIDAVIEMKRRNRTWGCKRIAQQIALAFGVDIDKDVVRRILSIHFYPEAGSGGPSWLQVSTGSCREQQKNSSYQTRLNGPFPLIVREVCDDDVLPIWKSLETVGSGAALNS